MELRAIMNLAIMIALGCFPIMVLFMVLDYFRKKRKERKRRKAFEKAIEQEAVKKAIAILAAPMQEAAESMRRFGMMMSQITASTAGVFEDISSRINLEEIDNGYNDEQQIQSNG